MNKAEAKKQIKSLNKALTALSFNTLFDHLPIARIANLVQEAGFNGEALNGIYCGHEGRVNTEIGFGKYLLITWSRAGDRNRFEIVSYAS